MFTNVSTSVVGGSVDYSERFASTLTAPWSFACCCSRSLSIEDTSALALVCLALDQQRALQAFRVTLWALPVGTFLLEAQLWLRVQRSRPLSFCPNTIRISDQSDLELRSWMHSNIPNNLTPYSPPVFAFFRSTSAARQ